MTTTEQAVLAYAADYSYHHPDPGAIKAAGYTDVLRYLSTDPTKNLTPGEAGSLHMAGLGIGVVWETTASRATQGFGAGQADAQAANSLANAVGVAMTTPIFYAVDEDVAPSAVLPYFQGIAAASATAKAAGVGRDYGPYGSVAIVDAMHQLGAPYAWQTEAWSGTTVSPNATIYQRVSPTRPPIPGGGYDEDVVLAPFPFWLETPQPSPAPAPAPPPPAPAPTPPSPLHAPDGNPWTLLGIDGIFGGMSTRATQWKDGSATDGVFGIRSKADMQRRLAAVGLYHGAIDSILGPQSVKALQERVGAGVDGIWRNLTTEALQRALNAARY